MLDLNIRDEIAQMFPELSGAAADFIFHQCDQLRGTTDDDSIVDQIWNGLTEDVPWEPLYDSVIWILDRLAMKGRHDVTKHFRRH